MSSFQTVLRYRNNQVCERGFLFYCFLFWFADHRSDCVAHRPSSPRASTPTTASTCTGPLFDSRLSRPTRRRRLCTGRLLQAGYRGRLASADSAPTGSSSPTTQQGRTRRPRDASTRRSRLPSSARSPSPVRLHRHRPGLHRQLRHRLRSARHRCRHGAYRAASI